MNHTLGGASIRINEAKTRLTSLKRKEQLIFFGERGARKRFRLRFVPCVGEKSMREREGEIFKMFPPEEMSEA